jgi:hypothetical protein
MTPFFDSVGAETTTRVEERAGAMADRCEVIHHPNETVRSGTLT